jgi:hypothetical protein
MSALDKLMKECGSDFAVVPLFDHTHARFSIDHLTGARSTTWAEAARLLPYHAKLMQHPGSFWPRNIDLPLMWYFHSHPEHEFYWLMEYDVRFTGQWPNFFRHFAGNKSDLLATTVFDHHFRPSWRHWSTLSSPHFVSDRERVRALFPLYRVSNAAMRALHLAYCSGWSGHYEVTIPTILKTRGFVLEDMGGDGAYVAPGNRNRFYRNSPGVAGLAPGTFTVAANTISESHPRNMLWHPIKG